LRRRRAKPGSDHREHGRRSRKRDDREPWEKASTGPKRDLRRLGPRRGLDDPFYQLGRRRRRGPGFHSEGPDFEGLAERLELAMPDSTRRAGGGVFAQFLIAFALVFAVLTTARVERLVPDLIEIATIHD
jgi:hypothetical protein